MDSLRLQDTGQLNGAAHKDEGHADGNHKGSDYHAGRDAFQTL